jgi:cell division protein FtsL
MRVPPFERYEKTLAGAGLFLVGLIVGCALFMSIYQHNFSLLSTQNQQMHSEIKDLKDTNRNLILNHKKSNQPLIHSIKVAFERKAEANKLDEVSENELRQKITQDLQFLNGTDVRKIKQEPMLYRNLLEGKTYHAVHERDYIINVRTLIAIDDELTVILNAVVIRK